MKKRKLVRIDMEFEVEWDDEKVRELDERSVEREVSILLVMESCRERDRPLKMVSAEAYKDSFYRDGKTPDDYVCSGCGLCGVKLWRQYQTVACNIELLCASCALENQGKKGPVDEGGKRTGEMGERTDQIGWLVPAVPDEENITFWGYTSVPSAGCRWWRDLPTHGGRIR